MQVKAASLTRIHWAAYYAAVVRQTEGTVKFPRVDTASNPMPEFRAVGIFTQESWGDDCDRIPIISIRNQKVEIPVETIFSRKIVDVYWGHWINLQNSTVTRRYRATDTGSGRSKLSHLLSEKQSRKQVGYCEQSPRGGGAQGTSYINGRRPSNLIKKFDIVLSVLSNSPKNNTV